MKLDPKFGWHILWITPLVIIGRIVGILIQYYKNYKRRRYMEAIMKDSEIAELVKLARIKE